MNDLNDFGLKLKYVNLPAHLQGRTDTINYNGLYKSRHFYFEYDNFFITLHIRFTILVKILPSENDFQNILAYSMSPFRRQHELEWHGLHKFIQILMTHVIPA